MKWVTAKNSSDVKLKGVTISFTKEDSNITEILLRDADGAVVRITKSDSYGRTVTAYVPAPPEKKKVYVVTGRFKDVVDISEPFDEEFEAKNRLRELQSADYSNDDFKVVEQEVEVLAAE